MPGEDVQQLSEQATAASQRGDWATTAELCSRLVRLLPRAADAWFMLGRACAEFDRLDEAGTAYREALHIKPEFAEAAHGLGYVLLRQGEWASAIDFFRQALRFNPRIAQACWGLGNAQQMLGNLREALEHYQQALQINPRHAAARLGIGVVLSLAGKQPLAVPHIREAIQLKPGYIDACIALAATLMPLGEPDEAEQLIETALEQDRDNIELISLAATIDQHKGKLEKARERLAPLVDAGNNEVNILLAWAALCGSSDEPGAAIPLLEQRLDTGPPLSATGQRNLHFNLGNLYDKNREYRKAFGHYRKGNALKNAGYDAAAREANVQATIAVYSCERMNTLPRSGTRSGRPVFVVGMPRSGTSLIEQILASHPAVFGAGELIHVIQIAGSLQATLDKPQPYPHCVPGLTPAELDVLAQSYLEQIDALSPDAARVVDKMPGNFMYLGLIEQLFPDARIIHSMRDPLDTCLSCYFQDFSRSHPYSYDLRDLGAFYRGYERVMQHWREVLSLPMLEVQYEELVSDRERVSRQMVDFCGLDWDDRCHDFHKTQRYVATASYDQVRRPLYTSSVSRWKNYAEFLTPLRETLGR